MDTKRLGEYAHACDADGAPQLTAEEVLQLLDDLAAANPNATIADVKAAVDEAMGKPWFDALRR
jgi:hypothetical protein